MTGLLDPINNIIYLNSQTVLKFTCRLYNYSGTPTVLREVTKKIKTLEALNEVFGIKLFFLDFIGILR